MECSINTGVVASPGYAMGPAFTLEERQPRHAAPEGAIVFAEQPCDELIGLLPIAGGIVTERGGVLSGFATLCREQGIPYVTALEGASPVFTPGAVVLIDAAAGHAPLIRVVSRHGMWPPAAHPALDAR